MGKDMAIKAAIAGAVSNEAESKRFITEETFNNRSFEKAFTINALNVFPSNSKMRFMRNVTRYITQIF